MVNAKLPPGNEGYGAACRLAVAWQVREKAALATLFELDARLGQTLAQSREPLLVQMRLAWWRDRLSASNPGPDPLLAQIRTHWADREHALARLVDAWEHLVGEAPLPRSAIGRFAQQRGAAIESFAEAVEPGIAPVIAGERWALADFFARASHAEERAMALDLGRALPLPRLLPKSLRGIAVLDELASRAIARGEPMLADRAAALVAWRVGMTGR